MSSTTIPRRCHASTSWPVTAGVTSAPSSSSGARAGRRRASSRSLGSFSAWARSGRSCSTPCAISGPPTSISSPSASIFAPPRSTSRSRATTRRTNSRSSGRPVAPWVSLTSSRGPSCAPRITPSAPSTAFLQATDHEQARDCSASVGGSGGGAALLPAATDHDPPRDCSASVGGSGGGAALLPAATDHDPPRDCSASVGGSGGGAALAPPQDLMEYIPILMVFAVSALVAAALLGIPALIAPRRYSRIKMEPFECGKDPVALPEGRFAIKFSTIAIFFIIFDIELLFVWPCATVFKSLGWFGYSVMLVFLGVLMLGFLYVGQKRGLEWE